MARLVVKIPDELHSDLKEYIVVRKGKLKGELSKTVQEILKEGLERRKRGSQAEVEESYRQLVDLAPDMIAIHQDGKMVYINEAGVKMLGAKSADELIGLDVSAFSPPEWRKTIEKRVLSIYEENIQTSRLRMPLLRLDGSTIDIEVTGIQVTYRGKPAVLVLILDMTEIQLAEKKSWNSMSYA